VVLLEGVIAAVELVGVGPGGDGRSGVVVWHPAKDDEGGGVGALDRRVS
jgi:hypothetical protein